MSEGFHDRLGRERNYTVTLWMYPVVFDRLTTAALTDEITKTEVANRAIELYSAIQEIPPRAFGSLTWHDGNGHTYEIEIRKTRWRSRWSFAPRKWWGGRKGGRGKA